MQKRACIVYALSLAALLLGTLSSGAARAEAAAPPQQPRAECPPGAGPNPPAVGRESNKTLSDQLAQSKGVICPPAGVDRDIEQKPPEGGTMKVIPPPGSPGGNQNVQPK